MSSPGYVNRPVGSTLMSAFVAALSSHVKAGGPITEAVVRSCATLADLPLRAAEHLEHELAAIYDENGPVAGKLADKLDPSGALLVRVRDAATQKRAKS